MFAYMLRICGATLLQNMCKVRVGGNTSPESSAKYAVLSVACSGLCSPAYPNRQSWLRTPGTAAFLPCRALRLHYDIYWVALLV